MWFSYSSKDFFEDFLTHTTKVNNGEVPKYYVRDSHPGIIPKEEWNMVQLELQRRTKLRYSYSSKNCFSSKLICADCGHLYGSKVWYSTDKQNKINTFISNLKNKSDSIADFDEELFNVMVDKAIVNRDKSIEFIFNSGYKVKVEARK